MDGWGVPGTMSRRCLVSKNVWDRNDVVHLLLKWLVGCRFESYCLLVRPGTIGGVCSVGIFLRDSSPFLRKATGMDWNRIIAPMEAERRGTQKAIQNA